MHYKLPLYIASILLIAFPIYAQEDDISCMKWGQTSFNENKLENGYCDVYDYWVPGLVTNTTWMTNMPEYSIGSFSWYNQGIMEDKMARLGYDPNAVFGIAVQSCEDVGRTAWLRPPGMEWQGPFPVVECGFREHMYTRVVHMEMAGELGFNLARQWGLVDVIDGERIVSAWRIDNVEIFLGSSPHPQGKPVNYVEWWKDMATIAIKGEIYPYWESWSINPDPRDD